MRRMARARGWLGLLALGAIGCGGGTAEDASVPIADVAVTTQASATPRPVKHVCEPGETKPCACPEDLHGTRTCGPDGTRFRACSCEAPKPPSETGIPACDALLAKYDRLTEDMARCAPQGVEAMRDARAAMKSAFTNYPKDGAGQLDNLVNLCTQTMDSLPISPCP